MTANPALGLAGDLLIAQGGTIVLGETTEIYGASTCSPLARALAEVSDASWWTASTGGSTTPRSTAPRSTTNRPPGTRQAALTTIYEKSLGAIAKSGSSPLNQVVGYGERVTRARLRAHGHAGYDPVSFTGQVAAACTLVVFTTGRGSVPSGSTGALPGSRSRATRYRHQSRPANMDVNAGRVVEGTPLEEVAEEIFELMLAVASGRPARARPRESATRSSTPGSAARRSDLTRARRRRGSGRLGAPTAGSRSANRVVGRTNGRCRG